MKKLIVILCVALCLSLPVSANDQYSTQYNNLGADSLSDALDENTREFFEQNGIDAADYNWVNQLTSGGVLKHIWQFVTGGLKTPAKTGILIAVLIFLFASVTAFGLSQDFEIAVYAVVIAMTVLISNDIWQTVLSAQAAIKGCSSFMLSFVPVFASVLAISGKTVTAPAMSALLLASAEAVSFVAAFTVLPIMSGYLALSISTAVSPLASNSALPEGVKKFSMWVLSLVSTLFLGVLAIQTSVNSAADNLALRTAKFILGTSVPIANGLLGDAVSTISASIGLLRSSIGIYGVAALCFTLLPIVIELVLWRCVLMLNSFVSQLFGLDKITSVLRAVDSMLSVLLSIILIIGGMFIISLTVVITATGKV